MLDVLIKVYNILDNVLIKGAYSTLELSKDKDEETHRTITRIVYGVLDNNIKYDYYISQLVSSRPKNKIRIILKIGMYCIYHMNSMPAYAVVDNCVEMTRKIGKKETTGFINAVLKKAIDYKYSYPKDKKAYLSVFYSKPQFLVDYYIDRYGIVKAEEILSSKPYELEHIRYNSLKIDEKTFIKRLKENNIDYIKSKAGGFFVRNDKAIIEMFNQGIITYQSMTSMLVVQAMELRDNSKILDTCSAPGGKAVYMAELSPSSEVIACDIHPHRIELINKYTKRMGVNNVKALINDALTVNNDYIDLFDYVLCDVPCSGLGLINKKPDIMLNNSLSDIVKLSDMQYNILSVSSQYVKSGGVLVYSTCTTIIDENEAVVNKFLQSNKAYRLDGIRGQDGQAMVNYLPDNSGQDGYFIARMVRL